MAAPAGRLPAARTPPTAKVTRIADLANLFMVDRIICSSFSARRRLGVCEWRITCPSGQVNPGILLLILQPGLVIAPNES
jgi:hypothetical protein